MHPPSANPTTATSTTTTLTPRQHLFTRHLAAGHSPAEAYTRAGYTSTGAAAHTALSKLLKHPGVAAQIARDQAEATLSTIASRSELIARLTRIFRSPDTSADGLNPPATEVTRRTIIHADGSTSTLTRTRSPSRLGAARQLAALLGIEVTAGEGRYCAWRQDLHHAAAREVHTACTGPASHSASPVTAAATIAASSSSASSACASPPGTVRRIGLSLNPRQRRFCETLSRGIPAVHAYRLAGYGDPGSTSPPTPAEAASASRLLRRPAVITYLRELRTAATAHAAPMASVTTPNASAGPTGATGATATETAHHATRGEILAYLTQIARAGTLDLRTQPRFSDHTITDEWEKSDGTGETRTSIRSVHPLRAIVLLSRMLGYLRYPPEPAPETPERRYLRDLYRREHPVPPGPAFYFPPLFQGVDRRHRNPAYASS